MPYFTIGSGTLDLDLGDDLGDDDLGDDDLGDDDLGDDDLGDDLEDLGDEVRLRLESPGTTEKEK